MKIILIIINSANHQSESILCRYQIKYYLAISIGDCVIRCGCLIALQFPSVSNLWFLHLLILIPYFWFPQAFMCDLTMVTNIYFFNVVVKVFFVFGIWTLIFIFVRKYSFLMLSLFYDKQSLYTAVFINAGHVVSALVFNTNRHQLNNNRKPESIVQLFHRILKLSSIVQIPCNPVSSSWTQDFYVSQWILYP